MSQPPNDESGLRATEARMRRALGLDGRPVSSSDPTSQLSSPSVTHRPPRRFVRDGEVPVSTVHRDQNDGSGSNKLEALRRTLAEQIAARERAEQLLREAEATVRDLQTKLAHERIAHEEAARRMEGEMRAMRQAIEAMQDGLVAERAARQQAEQDSDQAIAGRQEAEGRLQDAVAVQEAQRDSMASEATRSSRRATKGETVRVSGGIDGGTMVQPVDTSGGTMTTKKSKSRRPKTAESEGDFVEWWRLGWRERFR